MYYYQKFAIVGFILSFWPIVLGIIALTTSSWITIDFDQSTNQTYSYDLFGRCQTNQTTTTTSFSTPRCLQIIGYIFLIIGLAIGILCTTFINKHRIHFLAPIIIIIGNVIIIIGLFVQFIRIIEDLSKIRIHFGYSLISMYLTNIFAFLSAIYFSYTAGYMHRHILSNFTLK